MVYETVAKAKQKEAVNYLNENLFKTPNWLINNDIYGKTGLNGLKVIGDLQEGIIGSMFRSSTLNHLVQAATFPGAETYTIPELLADVKKGVWSELPAHKAIDVYRRQLQQMYVDRMDVVLNPPPVVIPQGITFGRGYTPPADNDYVDVKASVRSHLISLKGEINSAAATSTDQMTKIHLKEMSRRIEKALDPKK